MIGRVWTQRPQRPTYMTEDPHRATPPSVRAAWKYAARPTTPFEVLLVSITPGVHRLATVGKDGPTDTFQENVGELSW
jgi:hypothetical protein